MKKKKLKKYDETYYYSDPLNDDFAGTHIHAIKVNSDFKYHHKNIFFKIFSFFIYRMVARPVVYLYAKIKYNVKYVNKKAVKKVRKGGYFVYSNHVAVDGDAFITNHVTFPNVNDIIVNADTVSIKGIKTLVEAMGAFPLPNDIGAAANFFHEMKYRLSKKHAITIFPEAHIWPYYNGIREFPIGSYKYPALLKTPIITFCITLQKRKHSKRPRFTVYISDPEYIDPKLDTLENAKILHDKSYNFMKETTAKYSTYECNHFIYKPKEEKAD